MVDVSVWAVGDFVRRSVRAKPVDSDLIECHERFTLALNHSGKDSSRKVPLTNCRTNNRASFADPVIDAPQDTRKATRQG